MARDGENLFRRSGDRYWYFKYKGLDGKWHEESTGKELKSEARDERNDRLARYKAGQTPNDISNWPLERAIKEHLALREVQAPKSVRLETTCFNDGTRARRPALDKMMADARRGRFDIVLVWAADRLARSVKHFVEVLAELDHLGIAFVSFREQIDTAGPLGRAAMIIVSAIAELERSLIVERARAGIRRARLEGSHIGRRPLDIDRPAVLRDRDRGLSLTEVARAHGISRAMVSKIVRERRENASHKPVVQSPPRLHENRPPESAA